MTLTAGNLWIEPRRLRKSMASRVAFFRLFWQSSARQTSRNVGAHDSSATSSCQKLVRVTLKALAQHAAAAAAAAAADPTLSRKRLRRMRAATLPIYTGNCCINFSLAPLEGKGRKEAGAEQTFLATYFSVRAASVIAVVSSDRCTFLTFAH